MLVAAGRDPRRLTPDTVPGAGISGHQAEVPNGSPSQRVQGKPEGMLSVSTERRSVLQEMPEANYLVGHLDGPHYRLIMRFFYERHRAHVHYVRSDEIVEYVRRVFPDYGDDACRRQLDQLAKWCLIRVLPEQSKPTSLVELRRRPRTYQAERLAVRLEELRSRLETEHSAAASINPTSLDQLVERLSALAGWLPEGLTTGTPDDKRKAYELWSGLHTAFEAFSRSVEDYLGDLPRHKPKETLDYMGFLGYRDVLIRYLADYILRLFEHLGHIRHLLRGLTSLSGQLAGHLSSVSSQQVRADGSSPDSEAEQERFEGDIRSLAAYFQRDGDVDVLLDMAQQWVADITRHARRLSEQHHGATVREQTLLELGRRFSALGTLEEARWLAQVAFGATLPLHWRGEPPDSDTTCPWRQPPRTVTLYPVRRGPRRRVDPDETADRTGEQFRRMLAVSAERERDALGLAELFKPSDRLDLRGHRRLTAAQRQQLLRLIYRALSSGGRVSVGYRDWSVTVELPTEGGFASVEAPDGRLLLPRCVLHLNRERTGKAGT